MAKKACHSELVSETNKGGESLPLARTSSLATPSSGGYPRNAPDSAPIEAPYELPEGWKWTRLEEVADCLDGFRKPINATERASREGNIPYYGATGQVGWIDDFLTDEELVLLGEDGAPFLDLLKDKAYIISGKAWVNNHAHILRSKYGESGNKYLLNYLNSFNYIGYVNGTTRLKLTQGEMLKIPFPLPPTIAEQQHIVNRIETMFSKLDQAQEKAQAVLDSFETRKAAILHKAFTGQLKIDNEELTIEDWEETTIGECCKLGSGGTPSKSHPEYYENGTIPWLKTGEIDWNDIYEVEEKITQEGIDNSSAKIFPAESVVVAMYGMGVTRGKAAIIKIPTTTNQAVCVLQPNEKLNNRFLFYYFMCNYWQVREQSVGGNQLNLSGKIIAGFPIKLPPLNYQLSIVNFLDSVLEKETRAKEAAEAVLEQIDLLKKSILARAFRGEL